MPNKGIVFTGGGTAGHVIPNLFLARKLQTQFSCFYIGSRGMEKELVGTSMPFYAITSGKLRRYLSVQNFLDVFKIVGGFFQALYLLYRIRPSLVFSKGGYMAVPVCFAAWVLRIPVLTHESDASCGLATRLIAKVARQVLCTFESACVFRHAVYVGAIVREDIYEGSPEEGAKFLGLQDDAQEVLLVMGGSLGAESLNKILGKHLGDLEKYYFVVHLCGKGKRLSMDHATKNYVAYEYLDKPLKHVLARADYVVSRAGANAIFEILALGKPMLLVPLEVGSRGDQVVNAELFLQKSWALLMRERDEHTFVESIQKLKEFKPMRDDQVLNGLEKTLYIIDSYINAQ